GVDSPSRIEHDGAGERRHDPPGGRSVRSAGLRNGAATPGSAERRELDPGRAARSTARSTEPGSEIALPEAPIPLFRREAIEFQRSRGVHAYFLAIDPTETA